MPRNGSGVYSKPAGTTAVPNTTIESAKFNSVVDDLVADANAARPITAGGTGATNAADARDNLGIAEIWKNIAATDLAGLSTVSWTDLEDYQFLRLRAAGTPSGSSAIITFRTSSDNGSNYYDDTGDYVCFGSTITGAGDGSMVFAPSSGLTAMIVQRNPMDVAEFSLTFEMSNFNKAVKSRYDAFMSSQNADSPRQDTYGGFDNQTVALDALRMTLSAGTFTSGTAILEGILG